MIFPRKSRYYWRLFSAFFFKQKKTILMAAALAAIAFFLGPKVFDRFMFVKTEKIGLVGRYEQVNLPREVQKLLGSGLTEVKDDQTVGPSLAESWKIEHSGKQYIFKLKDGLTWHDGTPVLATDINYNFSDVNTVVLDQKTILFELKEPFSPFPATVSKTVFKKGLIGNGNYRVKDLETRSGVIEKIVLEPLDPKLPILKYYLYPTEESARNAFKLGEIDILKDLSSPSEIASWPNARISQKVAESRYVAIFFNTENQLLSEKSFRQALAYGIKKDWPSRALSPINPNSWAYNETVKPYDYDTENAKSLLEKAIGEAENVNLEISLSCLPSLLKEAEKIARDWEALGVKTNVKVINSLPEDFDAFLLAQEIPSDPDQYSLWHSTQPFSLTKFKNLKIDKLLEDGRRTFDQEERKEIYQDFQRFLVEDSPAIFLYHPSLYTIERI